MLKEKKGQASVEIFTVLGIILFLSFFILYFFPRYKIKQPNYLCKEIKVLSSIIGENLSYQIEITGNLKKYKIYTYENGIIQIILPNKTMETCKANVSFVNESFFGEIVSISKVNGIVYISSVFLSNISFPSITISGDGWYRGNVTLLLFNSTSLLNNYSIATSNGKFNITLTLPSHGFYKIIAYHNNLTFQNSSYSFNI